MKIVYLSSSIIPSHTANSIHVMKMSRSLAKLGHEVVLVAPNVKKGIREDVGDIYQYYGVDKNFQVLKMPMPNIKGRAYIYGLLAALKAKLLNADLVYCRNLTACYFASFFCKNVVFESHAPVIDSGARYEKQFKRLIKKKSFKKLIIITHALKEYYEQRYPSLAGRVHVAPDGADEFPENVEPANLGVGKNNERLQVGYVGHLYAGRGIELIFQVAKISQDFADFHLVGGTHEDIQNRKKQANELDIINVKFHGHVSPSDVFSYQKAFDVLIAPYQEIVRVSGGAGNTVKWMSPLKLFEYMSAGKAIIASNLPVLAEVLEDSVNALLCAPSDIHQWVVALDKLKDSDARAVIASKAYNDFIEQYSWNQRARMILEWI